MEKKVYKNIFSVRSKHLIQEVKELHQKIVSSEAQILREFLYSVGHTFLPHFKLCSQNFGRLATAEEEPPYALHHPAGVGGWGVCTSIKFLWVFISAFAQLSSEQASCQHFFRI
jgi:hypothetical protein